jgi:uncharacterized protein (TIGR02757 family)
MKDLAEIKKLLDSLYVKYNRHELIAPDPLQFVYNYTEKADMEIAGLLAASLAYGRVAQIEKSLIDLFKRMGDSPFEFIMGFNKSKRRKLADFKHRFNTGDDISDLFVLLKAILKKHGSIEAFFALGYADTDETIIPALTKFTQNLMAMHKGEISRGLKYMITDPARGSACKRLNLYLRWMVRDDDVDAGLWKSIDKAKLVVPIDVHMSRLCKILGFYEAKTVTLKTAVQITKNFSLIDPTDPVKYDFSLSRIGIIENCTGQFGQSCCACKLFKFCKKRNVW